MHRLAGASRQGVDPLRRLGEESLGFVTAGGNHPRLFEVVRYVLDQPQPKMMIPLGLRPMIAQLGFVPQGYR
jgi:hypothetical protein